MYSEFSREYYGVMYALPLSPPTTPSSSCKEMEVSEIGGEALNGEGITVTNSFTLFVFITGGPKCLVGLRELSK